MTDVLDLARARRDALKTEIAHLDAFIRMGEKIARDAEPVDVRAAAARSAEAPDPARA